MTYPKHLDRPRIVVDHYDDPVIAQPISPKPTKPRAFEGRSNRTRIIGKSDAIREKS